MVGLRLDYFRRILIFNDAYFFVFVFAIQYQYFFKIIVLETQNIHSVSILYTL